MPAGQDETAGLEEELDTLSGWLLDRFVREQIAPDRIAGVSAIVAHIRHVVERRRNPS
ncbi:hypothetical protein [Candidatus Accumulibacter aalborgensis]|nr:hypothetical protein [Candidatus Accumulibacter aalborgensis]